MIVAKSKSLEYIKERIRGRKKVAVVGCGGCVTVRPVGGEKQVAELAAVLRVWARKEGLNLELKEDMTLRQCEPEFLDEINKEIEGCDAAISLACGVGAQCLAERYPGAEVTPGVDVVFMGATIEPGLYWKRCVGCGDCIIGENGGYCPVSRCAKSLLNGPCGGSQDGNCEVDPEIPCVWQQIYDRSEARGAKEEIDRFVPPKDWSLRPANLTLEHARVKKEERDT
ncbi:MAG: methylenetetrahydrofolate reductase C-terminal domain-containing protein [Candidatus Brocadiales bacterium]